MNKRKGILIGFLAVALLVLVALLVINLTGHAIKTNDPIKIGVTTALTGNYAYIGQDLTRGITEAINEANKENVIKQKIELLIEDNGADPVKAISAYQTFKISGAKIVFGSFSGVTGALNPLSQQDKVILMYNAMVPTYAENNEYAFKIYADTTAEANKFLDYNKDKTFTFVYANNPTTALFNSKLKEKNNFDSYGVDVKEIDFKTIILKLKEKNVERIMLFVYPNKVLSFMKQARELGYTPKEVITSSDGANKNVLNEIENYVGQETTFLVLAYGKENQDYLFGYDLAKTLITAMKSCEDQKNQANDPECLKQEIPKVKFQGKSGIIDMANGRVALVYPGLYTVKDKQLILIN